MLENLNVYTPISNLGYGVHGLNTTKALAKYTKNLYISTIGQTQIEHGDEHFIELHVNPLLFKSKAPSLFIFHDQFGHQFTGNPRIIFSVFELDNISPISKHMLGNTDIIFTTTQDHKNVLINSGLDESKIYIVHEGADPLLYNMNPCKPLIKTNKPTFITVGKKEKRKNTDKIIQAFLDVCKYKETALICHTFNPFIAQKNHMADFRCFTDIASNIIELGFIIDDQPDYLKLSNGVCDIYFTKQVPVNKLIALYKSANIGIQCSSAEGWNLPTNELLACGIPCIATTCFGHREFLPKDIDIQNQLTIQCQDSWLKDAKDDIWFKGGEGRWFEIPIDEIRQKIELALELHIINPYGLISNYILNNYTWDHAAKTIHDILI